MPALPDPGILSNLPLFRGLTGEQLSALNEQLHLKKCRAGTNLIFAEQAGEIVYIILKGTVKIHIEQGDGTSVILAILGEGETVGEMSLVDNASRCANVATLEDSELLWMNRADFQRRLRAVPEMACNLAGILAARLRVSNEQIKALAALEVESRVARQLLAFAERYGQATGTGEVMIPIRLTQGDLASLVGASRERINQVMVSYRERRYVSVNRQHHIIIHNQQALRNRCV
jgi:CRP/FNR family transcriptional regulator, cyclic AMP receptor protein